MNHQCKRIYIVNQSQIITCTTFKLDMIKVEPLNDQSTNLLRVHKNLYIVKTYDSLKKTSEIF